MPDNEQMQEALLREAEASDLKSRMLAFLASKGGKANFAEYMAENLYGDTGYYSRYVDISHGGDFSTLAEEPAFAQMFFSYLHSKGLTGKDFLELGGGTGVFKRNYLRKDSGAKYTSVDKSPMLSAAQSSQTELPPTAQHSSIVSGAENLDFLASNSINGIIFSNELLDALPVRMLVSEMKNGSLGETIEIFIESQNGGISHGWDIPVQDEDYLTFMEYIREKGRLSAIKNSAHVTFCLPTTARQLVASVDRVMNSGRMYFCDYGFSRLNDKAVEDTKIGPHYIEKIPGHSYTGAVSEPRMLGAWVKALDRPYKTDLTYLVNFPYYHWLFKRQNKDLRVDLYNQEDFFSQRSLASTDDNESIKRYQEKIKLAAGAFKVLEVIKS